MKGLTKDADGNVSVFGTLLGNVSRPAIADLWKKAQEKTHKKGKKDLIKTECKVYNISLMRDYTVCPHCGSDRFHWRVDVNGVQVGYCLACRTDVYRTGTKVLTQVSHIGGYLITPKELIDGARKERG